MSAHNVEGPQGATTAEDECCASKGVAGLAQEAQLVLQGHIGALVVGESLQVVLHLLNVLPDRLRHHWVVLMQLTAMAAEQQLLDICFLTFPSSHTVPGTKKFHTRNCPAYRVACCSRCLPEAHSLNYHDSPLPEEKQAWMLRLPYSDEGTPTEEGYAMLPKRSS